LKAKGKTDPDAPLVDALPKNNNGKVLKTVLRAKV
jgi:acyl-CoA synthetase (AMP-forming)/AMP-acid ligase II